jgi:tetratricopeptide (TPR) repeat protein
MVTTKNRIAPLFLPLLLLALVVAGCTPRGARALLEGRRLLNAGDPTNAVVRLQVATALLPTNAVAWNYLGLAYHQARQTTNALAAYHKALTRRASIWAASILNKAGSRQPRRLSPAAPCSDRMIQRAGYGWVGPSCAVAIRWAPIEVSGKCCGSSRSSRRR